MNLPPEFQFYEEFHLLVFRPHGILNKESVDLVVRVVSELEGTLQAPFNRFWDASGYEGAALDFKFATDVSLNRRLATSGRPTIKSAILAIEAGVIHYARLLALLTQGSPIKVRVFEMREEVAKWLGVPLEIIMPVVTPDKNPE